MDDPLLTASKDAGGGTRPRGKGVSSVFDICRVNADTADEIQKLRVVTDKIIKCVASELDIAKQSVFSSFLESYSCMSEDESQDLGFTRVFHKV